MVKVMSQGHQLRQALDLLLANNNNSQYQYLLQDLSVPGLTKENSQGGPTLIIALMLRRMIDMYIAISSIRLFR